MRGSRFAILALLTLAAAALVAAGCGDDDDGGSAEPQTTAAAEAGELPADLVVELEAMCGELIGEIGSLSGGDDLERGIDELQDAYIADLEAIAERVPEAERPAFDGYVAAEEEAFALSPPPRAGEPQPELEAAQANAERAAFELGFSSCSGV